MQRVLRSLRIAPPHNAAPGDLVDLTTMFAIARQVRSLICVNPPKIPRLKTDD
jgi:hypothetical protein